MHIGIIKRLGKPYNYVNTTDRKWLKHYKREVVGPDEAVISYIRYTYPNVKLSIFTRNDLNGINMCDIVFLGFEEITLPFKRWVLEKKNKDKFEWFIKELKNIKNLYPKFEFVQFITDKCKYLEWVRSMNINISPTFCFAMNTKTNPTKVKQKLRATSWDKVFIKPIPGAESQNTLELTKDELKKTDKTLNNHIKYIKNRGYFKIVTQKYMEEIATIEHPELRTFWIGNKYQYTIETTGTGNGQAIRKTSLPRILISNSKKILKGLTKKFNQKLLITRLDWGYDNGAYFLNEIEYAPGTFAELFPRYKWKLDKEIGDRMIEISRNF